jgi:tetratricopeptide (TPR) repeat protein
MVHDNLGAAFLRKGELDQAMAQFQKALELKPDYASSHNNLAIVLLHENRVDEAIAHLQKALEIQPGNELALKNLNRVAWLLATCPDASIRNGPKAVELARQADELTGGANPMVAGTLAAAYAEAGRFADAVAAVRRATQAAEAQGDGVTADALRTQMRSYEANQPFRDDAGRSAPKR